MAIKVINRGMNIPASERIIGYIGDNLVEVRMFELPRFYGDVDLAEFDFKLDTQSGDGDVKNIIDLDKAVSGDKIVLTWLIKESHILNPGHMSIQIRAFKDSEEKWHSAQDYVKVQPSINAEQSIPDPLPSEFVQMEQRVTDAKNAAIGAAQDAEAHADRAQDIADTFSDVTLPAAISAVEAAGQAKVDLAKQEADRAKAQAEIAETNAGETLGYANQAFQYKEAARGYAEDAEDFAGDAEEQAQIAANNVLNGVNTHNESTAAHADIRDDIRTVEAIARGKMNSYVFDTYEDMMEAVQNPEFVEQLKVGDNLYIRDVGVKDYWWDGAAPSELEAEAPDLTDYYTREQVDAMMPITIEQADYEDLVASGQVEAGRTYFIIEGDEE